MKRSILHPQHEKAGASFETVGTWEMPAHYGDPLAEHQAVRQRVGIADLSHRGLLQVKGDDRITWLQSIISQDIRELQPGQWLYSTFMSAKGKILSYFRVYRLDEVLLVEDMGEVGDLTFQALRKFLLYGTKAKLESCNGQWGMLLVSGPEAATLLHTAVGVDVSDIQKQAFLNHKMDDQPLLIARTEETGEPDFELFGPIVLMPSLWENLWSAGFSSGLRPFGTKAREMLRIEAGIPQLGPDINDHIVPPEANLEGKAFSLSKGCYPGQEVVARMDTYGSVKRRLVGLVVESPPTVIPHPGTKIYSGQREVGWISSAVYSPTLQKPIALAFPLRDFTTAGTTLTVKTNGQDFAATVHALPFYSRP